MKNRQAPMPYSHNVPNQLTVKSIFPTIQGEGYFTGRPATFIRLAGCNLQCPGCDTDYTSNQVLDISNIIEAVNAYNHTLVVLTGGEPFRQNIGELLKQLILNRHSVVIETNGIYPVQNADELPYMQLLAAESDYLPMIYISCSPKTHTIHESIHKWCSYYKYVLSHKSVDPDDGLPIHVLGNNAKQPRPVARPLIMDPQHHDYRSIYLMPADESNVAIRKRNIEKCIDSCMRFGYTLNLQIHKIVGVR